MGMETENKGLIDVQNCPCDGCKANPCGHPAWCVSFALWLNKTVDAVPVVRCKDCKHSVWDEENEMWKCVESAEYDSNYGDYIGWVHYHNADFYCADGERKDNGQD